MRHPMHAIDAILNKITMYRLVTYGLSLLAGVALLLSLTGLLSLSFIPLLVSLGLIVAVSYLLNLIMQYAWDVPSNNESWLITALIVFLLSNPPSDAQTGIYIVLAAAIAIVSKYIISYRGKHIFNPAAYGVFAVGIIGFQHATWWVGNKYMWPIVLIIGLLITRKIRKIQLVFSFFATSIVAMLVSALLSHDSLRETVILAITASPLIFLGTIMLTEPGTMPPHRNQQLVFGILVGVLYALHPSVAGYFVFPEIALLIGNGYGYIFSSKKRLTLRLLRIDHVSDTVKSFIFETNEKLSYMPGQYIEWTLGHHNVDSRGNRRTFSLASSPTEDTFQLGVKFYERSSSYKRALKDMKIGDTIFAGQIAGDFTLPKDPNQKIAMIAGGIGITPFRSILKYLVDTKQKRDITLYYLVSDPSELAYKDVLNEAYALGIKIFAVCSQKPGNGFEAKFDESLLRRTLPDFTDRIFYISGPNAMVNGQQVMLQKLGVKRHNFVTDHFSGY